MHCHAGGLCVLETRNVALIAMLGTEPVTMRTDILLALAARAEHDIIEAIEGLEEEYLRVRYAIS